MVFDLLPLCFHGLWSLPFLVCLFSSLLLDLNVLIVHPQIQLMDHIRLQPCQRVGITAFAGETVKDHDGEYVGDLPTWRRDEGHLLTLCGNEAWEKFGCFVTDAASARYWVCYSSCQWGCTWGKEGGAVGASDLPRAAV